MQPWRKIRGQDARLLLIADHASNAVPTDIDLGIGRSLLDSHIAVDLGVRSLAQALCARLGCPAILGAVSRLVIDFNREEEAPHVVPIASDGQGIPGNWIGDDKRRERVDRYWRPYHDHIAARITQSRPAMLISLHSFTPRLETQPEHERPWELGIIYNDDDRSPRVAIPLLEAAGVIVGDQLPYSGKLLNATMNRHGEANGIPYLGIEVRQDLIGDDDGVNRVADLLAPVIAQTAARVTGECGAL